MSFSKSFTGTALAVLAALAAFPAEQRKVDESIVNNDAVTEGHARQIDAGVTILSAAVRALPEDAEVKASLYGHANDDQSGAFGFQIQVSNLPTPAAADGSAGSDAPGVEAPVGSEPQPE